MLASEYYQYKCGYKRKHSEGVPDKVYQCQVTWVGKCRGFISVRFKTEGARLGQGRPGGPLKTEIQWGDSDCGLVNGILL